jgi:gamma-glutamylputrescine oxidase
VETPDWGPSPWRVDCAVPSVPLPARCQVAIVGAGFTGLATAYELARRGVDVVVLEALRIGNGASGRTGGIVLEGTAVGSLPDASDCLATLEAVVDDARIDCDLRIEGCNEISHVDVPGGAPGWHDAGRTLAVARRVPGGTVDPGRLVAGLARAALGAGAAIHEESPVEQVEQSSAPRLRVRGRTLKAETVVLALNAFTPVLLPTEVRPVLTLAVRTAPLGHAAFETIGLGDGLPFYTIDLPYLWGRIAGEHLILGAGLVFPHGPDVRTVEIGQDEARDAFEQLERRIRGFHPALERVAIDARWGGPIAFRDERVPVLARHPAAPGVIVTGACAGHGIALGTKVAKLVADAITRGRALPVWGALSSSKRGTQPS